MKLKVSNGANVIEGKHVGAKLPRRVHDNISLYALAHGVTKTNIIKHILINWCKRNYSESYLINKLKQNIQHHWQSERSKNPNLNLEDFKNEIEKYLISKGILSKVIEQILKEL
jgi:DNA-directed RNA polymerase beta' subunit